MNVSFLDLREKEVINVYSGSRLGRIVDIVFDVSSGEVLGIVVPGDKKLFKKSEDVFVPLDKLKRIGSDVILVGLQNEGIYSRQKSEQNRRKENIDAYYENGYISPNQNSGYAAQAVSGKSFQNSNNYYGEAGALSGIGSSGQGTPRPNFYYASSGNGQTAGQSNLNLKHASAVGVNQGQSKSKNVTNDINFNNTVARYQTQNQSQSNSSYVRLKPLSSKKYK